MVYVFFPPSSCILNNAQRFGLVRNVEYLFICLSIPHTHGGSTKEQILCFGKSNPLRLASDSLMLGGLNKTVLPIYPYSFQSKNDSKIYSTEDF